MLTWQDEYRVHNGMIPPKFISLQSLPYCVCTCAVSSLLISQQLQFMVILSSRAVKACNIYNDANPLVHMLELMHVIMTSYVIKEGTAVSHNTNGGNLVWFGNQNEVIGDSRVNGLSRCFSLFLFLHLNKGQLTWNVRRTDNRRVCYSPISLLCVV